MGFEQANPKQTNLVVLPSKVVMLHFGIFPHPTTVDLQGLNGTAMVNSGRIHVQGREQLLLFAQDLCS